MDHRCWDAIAPPTSLRSRMTSEDVFQGGTIIARKYTPAQQVLKEQLCLYPTTAGCDLTPGQTRSELIDCMRPPERVFSIQNTSYFRTPGGGPGFEEKIDTGLTDL